MTDVMTELTPREKVTQRLLGIAALEKLIAQERAALREEAKAAFVRPGQREVAELNGVILGNVRLDKPAEGWKVTNPAAFEDWVRETHPEHIVTVTSEQVADSYTKAVLSGVAEGDTDSLAVDLTTGEFVAPPGISYVKGEPRLVVTPTKEAPAAVREALGATAAQLGIGAA